MVSLKTLAGELSSMSDVLANVEYTQCLCSEVSHHESLGVQFLRIVVQRNVRQYDFDLLPACAVLSTTSATECNLFVLDSKQDSLHGLFLLNAQYWRIGGGGTTVWFRDLDNSILSKVTLEEDESLLTSETISDSINWFLGEAERVWQAKEAEQKLAEETLLGYEENPL